jgi:hypothetical protein
MIPSHYFRQGVFTEFGHKPLPVPAYHAITGIPQPLSFGDTFTDRAGSSKEGYLSLHDSLGRVPVVHAGTALSPDGTLSGLGHAIAHFQ